MQNIKTNTWARQPLRPMLS